ncbi:MAG: septal ring lytic transglycosylase RlpA family protein [Anaeromyxobacteraceae bacterium]
MTLRRAAAAAGATAALLAACAHPATRPEGPANDREGRPAVETGVASFYSESLEGRRTASGGRYRGQRMTCAHRRYPFGSVLRVTEVESGKSVLVEVTDRGPFAEGRIVDLSYAAARALGILERGVARVRVERVR